MGDKQKVSRTQRDDRVHATVGEWYAIRQDGIVSVSRAGYTGAALSIGTPSRQRVADLIEVLTEIQNAPDRT